jgi:hypothetical protein
MIRPGVGQRVQNLQMPVIHASPASGVCDSDSERDCWFILQAQNGDKKKQSPASQGKEPVDSVERA